LFETLLENARLEQQVLQQSESAKVAADSSAQQVHRLQVQLAAVESDRQVAARREQVILNQTHILIQNCVSKRFCC
jgi:hypothetical protein